MQRALGRRARLAASSGVARHRPGAGRAGISWGLLILLLAVLAIFWLGYTLSKQSETADLHAAQDAMSEPETMLARFFVARGQDYELSDVRWQELLAYMSRDDQQWFNQNLAALVDLARKASFAPMDVGTDEARRYAALQFLLHFALRTPRPIVSTIQRSGAYAVAFVHDPNAGQTMRPVFLIREEGLWKIRRFLGERDNPDVLGALARAKQAAGQPLDDDEKLCLADEKLYAKRKEDQYYLQSGFTADQIPGGMAATPTATPTPTPAVAAQPGGRATTR